MGENSNSGSGSYIRGSADLHILPESREKVRELGKTFKRKGCFWRVYSSTQARALETAHAIATGCPDAQFMTAMPDLESWHLGGFEGKLKTPEILKEIQELVEKRPWSTPSGMGKDSTIPGESFLMFRNRVLNAFKQLMECCEKHPSKRILVVTHFHDIQMLDAWLAKYDGCPGPQDVEYDPKIYNQDKGFPGEVTWVGKTKEKWIFKRLDKDLDKGFPTPLPPGLYVVRHEKTDWN